MPKTALPLPRGPASLLAVLAFALVPAFAMPVAAQGTAEQQEACTPDAVRLCAASIPDIPKTTACMKAHVAQLSPRCRAAFNEATGSPAKAKAIATRGPAPPPKAHVMAREEAMRARREARAARAAARRARPAEREATIASPPPAPPRADRPVPRDVAPPAAPVVATPPQASSALPGLADYRAQIARDCREGLIDPFTCRNTLQALSTAE